MYKVKTTEWELEGEELEKSKYIIDYIERLKKLQATGQTIDQDGLAAFNYFKMEFYHEFTARVGIHLTKMGEITSGLNYYPHMNLAKDGKKVIGYRVEKEEL